MITDMTVSIFNSSSFVHIQKPLSSNKLLLTAEESVNFQDILTICASVREMQRILLGTLHHPTHQRISGVRRACAVVPQREETRAEWPRGTFRSLNPTKLVVSNVVKVNFSKPQQLHSDFYNDLRNMQSKIKQRNKQNQQKILKKQNLPSHFKLFYFPICFFPAP